MFLQLSAFKPHYCISSFSYTILIPFLFACMYVQLVLQKYAKCLPAWSPRKCDATIWESYLLILGCTIFVTGRAYISVFSPKSCWISLLPVCSPAYTEHFFDKVRKKLAIDTIGLNYVSHIRQLSLMHFKWLNMQSCYA
jgi:hypothetical protein